MSHRLSIFASRSGAPRPPAGEPRRPEGGGAYRGVGDSFRGGFGGEGLEFIRLLEESPEVREKIGLTEEQKQKLLQLKERVTNAMPAMREKAEQARTTLRDLEQKADAKEEDLLNALDAQLAAEGDLRKLGLRTRLQARKIFTPEQMEKISAVARERRERYMREGGPGGDVRRPRAEGDRPQPPPGGPGADRPREGDRPREADRPREGASNAPWMKDDGKAGKI